MDVSVFFVSVKYGKIPDEERADVLPGVDFFLPADHADTATGLAAGLVSGSGSGPLEVRAGGTMDHPSVAGGRVPGQGAPADLACALRGGIRDH